MTPRSKYASFLVSLESNADGKATKWPFREDVVLHAIFETGEALMVVINGPKNRLRLQLGANRADKG